MSRPFATRSILIVLALAGLVSACDPASASPSPSAPPSVAPSSAPTPSASPSSAGSSQDPAATFDAIEGQVVKLRELQAKQKVEREVIDEATLRTKLAAEQAKQTPPEIVAANERLYKALGLLPADADLNALTLEMLGAGVVGFYDDDLGKMFVVSRSGDVGPAEQVTYAHEYTHALQDQNFTVFKDQKGVMDQSDWFLARQAIFEGDATVVMSYWAIANLTQAELAEYAAAGNDPETQALLAKIPPIMTETLTYPYTTGAFYVQSAQLAGGWSAVDDFYARMPESTEQILHPEKYAANESPVDVGLPTDIATRLGSGWTVPLTDSFGELQDGIWLRLSGVDRKAADAAAAGWGGDRLAVIDGPDDAWAVAIKTAWDTTADAADFEAAATTALAKAQGIAHVLPGEGGKVRWVVVASDAATMSKVAGVLGLAG
jgi:hypothetical protein